MKKAIIKILENNVNNEDTALQIFDVFQESLSILENKIRNVSSECIECSEPKFCNYRQRGGNKCLECLNFSVWDMQEDND